MAFHRFEYAIYNCGRSNSYYHTIVRNEHGRTNEHEERCVGGKFNEAFRDSGRSLRDMLPHTEHVHGAAPANDTAFEDPDDELSMPASVSIPRPHYI